MPSHYKDKKGAARAKALKEHKDAVKKDKKKKTQRVFLREDEYYQWKEELMATKKKKAKKKKIKKKKIKRKRQY